MTKFLTIVLIALWACLAVIIGINIYRQYQVSRLQIKILNDYKLISEVNSVFKNVQDSLAGDAAAKEKLAKELAKPYPIKDSRLNWLALKLAIIALTILTALNFWFYYRKKALE